MDKIEKALKRLNRKEKEKLREILFQIDKADFSDLDLKKLRGRKDVFRVRKGSLRIIFRKTEDSIKVLTLERKGSKTYRK